jgi:hypothetical protein
MLEGRCDQMAAAFGPLWSWIDWYQQIFYREPIRLGSYWDILKGKWVYP